MEVDDYNKYINKITKKFDDGKVKKKFDDAMKFLEELYEKPVMVNILIDNNNGMDYDVLEFKTLDKNADFDSVVEYVDFNGITLGEFINLLKREDEELKVLISNKYLINDQLNEVNHVILTTVGDKVIIVPKTEKNEEN